MATNSSIFAIAYHLQLVFEAALFDRFWNLPMPASQHSAAVLLMVASNVTALPALAEDGSPESVDIVVNGLLEEKWSAQMATTATKTTTSILETPQSITTITREQIDLMNIRSLSDASRYAAGVFDAGRDDQRGFFGNIRGFSPDVYLDGLRARLRMS